MTSEEEGWIEIFLSRFTSDISVRKHRKYLEHLARHLHAMGTDFTSATFTDILAWLRDINEKNVLVVTKERYRRLARQFFDFIVKRLHVREHNPVPDREEFPFAEKDRVDEVLTVPLDEASARRLLAFFKAKDMTLYIGTRTLFETGMRIGELASIPRDRINLETRMIYTRGKMGIARYFIPKIFVPDMTIFLHYQDQVNPGEEYLFPSLYTRKSGHVSEAFFRSNLARARETLGLSCSTNPHAWRDLINTARAIKFKLDPDSNVFLSILLCQRPTGVNAAHYLKLYNWKNPATWEAHRDLYDEWYPW